MRLVTVFKDTPKAIASQPLDAVLTAVEEDGTVYLLLPDFADPRRSWRLELSAEEVASLPTLVDRARPMREVARIMLSSDEVVDHIKANMERAGHPVGSSGRTLASETTKPQADPPSRGPRGGYGPRRTKAPGKSP